MLFSFPIALKCNHVLNEKNIRLNKNQLQTVILNKKTKKLKKINFYPNPGPKETSYASEIFLDKISPNIDKYRVLLFDQYLNEGSCWMEHSRQQMETSTFWNEDIL